MIFSSTFSNNNEDSQISITSVHETDYRNTFHFEVCVYIKEVLKQKDICFVVNEYMKK